MKSLLDVFLLILSRKFLCSIHLSGCVFFQQCSTRFIRTSEALKRGNTQPSVCLCIVPRDAFTPMVRMSQTVLRIRKPLLRSHAIPPGGFFVVLWHTLPSMVGFTQAEPRRRIPLFSGGAKRCSGFFELLRDAFSLSNVHLRSRKETFTGGNLDLG